MKLNATLLYELVEIKNININWDNRLWDILENGYSLLENLSSRFSAGA